jgi:hypothetical protein
VVASALPEKIIHTAMAQRPKVSKGGRERPVTDVTGFKFEIIDFRGCRTRVEQSDKITQNVNVERTPITVAFRPADVAPGSIMY